MELERARDARPAAATQTAAPTPSRTRRAGPLLGILAAGAAGALLVSLLGPGAKAPPPLRLSIPLPASQQLGMSDDSMLVFSPDGSSLVMTVIEDGRRWLVRRHLGEASSERIEGTEGARAPFFSPDGKWLGFISGGKLRKVAAEGGRPFALAEQNGAGGAAWGEDDRILFAPIYTEGLFRVPAEGGETERVTTPDRARGELGHWWPQILPGGRTAIFTAFCTPLDTSRVEAVDLETGEVRDVVEGGFFGRYVPSGHLLYVKGARLFAASFDPVQATVTGPAQSVLDDVHVAQTEALSLLDVSVDGTLAWVPGSVADPEREIVWVDREGRPQPAVPEKRRYRGVSLSPDGRSLVTAILGESLDLWTFSLGQGTLSRLTSGPRTEFHPLWSRDGRSILFVLDRPPFEIHRIGMGASAEGEPLWEAELDTIATGLSPDGRHVVYTLTEPDTGKNVWVASLDGSGVPRALRASPYEEDFGTFSPDGRWIAYQSDETGRPEVYVEAFPGPGERHQISADGGAEPVWAHGSGEIFYRHGDEMRVVPTRSGSRFEFEPSRSLFTLPFDNMGNSARNYDVTPDGQRVVAVRIPALDAPRRVDIVTHWLDEVTRQVPN
jgi:serine/threonine-protein kinase